MQAFSLSAKFARESAMLKLPEERKRWSKSTYAGRGGRERRVFFLPSPSPLSFFRPRTYRKGYYFYSPQSSTVIKSKMAATTILRTRTTSTRTRFCPPKIRLHCRLPIIKLAIMYLKKISWWTHIVAWIPSSATLTICNQLTKHLWTANFQAFELWIFVCLLALWSGTEENATLS